MAISATPSGKVTFLSGDTVLGTSTLNSDGVARYSTSKLSVGKHAITASYAGNDDYATGKSTSQIIAIIPTSAN